MKHTDHKQRWGELLVLPSEECLSQIWESHRRVSDLVIVSEPVILLPILRTQSTLLLNHHYLRIPTGSDFLLPWSSVLMSIFWCTFVCFVYVYKMCAVQPSYAPGPSSRSVIDRAVKVWMPGEYQDRDMLLLVALSFPLSERVS